MITLQKTRLSDLEFVRDAESHSENRDFVYQWTYAEHESALHDPNLEHYIILYNQVPSGYVILDDVLNPSHSINLRRLVVVKKGLGIGKKSLDLIKSIVFGSLNANRLWLDVFCDNIHAYQLYQKSGFREEGLLRDSYLRNGIYVSQYIMAILKNEYLELAKLSFDS